MPAKERPDGLSTGYEMEFHLRPGNKWLGMIPRKLENIEAWLKSQYAFKKVPEQEILMKAEHILEEVGGESKVLGHCSFKRTREGNLYLGAGCILGGIKQAARITTRGNGAKRWLRDRLWIIPGKVCFFSYDGDGKRHLKKEPDGINERFLPPDWNRPAAIIHSDFVQDCGLRFQLWTSQDIQEQELLFWLDVASNNGLAGYRTSGQGKFDFRIAKIN